MSSFLIVSYMRIDQVMIGSMLGADEVGVFSVAVSLSEFWLFVPTILISSITPYLTKIRQNSPQAYDKKLRQLYSLMFWMGVTVGSLVMVFGESLVQLLYGEAYVDAHKPLVISIWSGLFVSQALARGIWLINEDLQLYRLLNNILAVVLNIFLNWCLIPHYGIIGAAAATLLTQWLGTWVFPLFWKPMRASTFAMIAAANPMYLLSGRV